MLLSFLLHRLNMPALVGIWLLMLASSCGSTSNILIAPRQDFVVGGGANEAFRMTVVNEGTVPIRLSERLEYGESINLGFLSRGDRRKLKFLAGSAAVFTNPATDTAQISLRIAGQENLEMGYEPR